MSPIYCLLNSIGVLPLMSVGIGPHICTTFPCMTSSQSSILIKKDTLSSVVSKCVTAIICVHILSHVHINKWHFHQGWLKISHQNCLCDGKLEFWLSKTFHKKALLSTENVGIMSKYWQPKYFHSKWHCSMGMSALESGCMIAAHVNSPELALMWLAQVPIVLKLQQHKLNCRL